MKFSAGGNDSGAGCCTESLFTLLIGISGAVIVTSLVEIISSYEEPFYWILFINSLITFICNIIFLVILEAIHFYKKNQEARIVTEKLKKENYMVRLDTLKSQLNPHFLFNSLNVLSSLIEKDKSAALNFIDEFALIYRYTLDVIDKNVVTLKEEMNMVKSYIFLQEIRFENAVDIVIEIEADKLEYLVPPLSLQTLLENAFKHNIASPANPLTIRIFTKEKYLTVKNKYLPRETGFYSKGIGLDNLKKRYLLICGEEPQFSLNGQEFLAVIPLVTPE